MRLGRKFNPNRIARLNVPTGEDNAHYTRLPNEVSGLIPVEAGSHKPRLKVVDLRARRPQPRHFHYSVRSQVQLRSSRQSKQVDATRGDVFPDISRPNLKTGQSHFVEELGMDQMHLPQIRGIRVLCNSRTMLDSRPKVRIAFYPEPRKKPDRLLICLAERMRCASANGYDDTFHRYQFAR